MENSEDLQGHTYEQMMGLPDQPPVGGPPIVHDSFCFGLRDWLGCLGCMSAIGVACLYAFYIYPRFVK
jgi:hypothetical protein